MRASQLNIEGRATMAHSVPPMPTVENTPPPAMLPGRDAQPGRARRASTETDDRLDKAMRKTDFVTAVEIDAVAKAEARAAVDADVRTDVSVSALGDAAQAVGDATETNLHILPEAESSATTPAPALLARPPMPGDEPSLARPVTLELAAQTVLSDPALMRITDQVQVPRGPRTTNEMTAQSSIEELLAGEQRRTDETAAQTGFDDDRASGRPRTTFEMGAQTTLGANDPLAGDSIPPRGSLSAELAAQQVDGEGGDRTDVSRQRDTDVSRRTMSASDVNEARERTPLPTHAARGGDHTPIPTKEPRKGTLSTAPSNLKPPKATEVAVSGPTPGCPQCESPMAWVEEHLRFYCKQCRMYF